MAKSIKWAGSKDAFLEVERVIEARLEASADVLKQASDWEDDEDEKECEHYMMEMIGNVAVINIRGALIEGSAGWWGRYYDICGYDDIRNAIVAGVNAGAKQIMINIMSPGGMVLGIGALTDFIKEVDARVPCTFFSESYCASGGVWLSTSTGKFFASRHAEIGSVGVIAVATEYTEYFKEMGITKSVFKSTPLKASGNPNEKLDAENSAEIQRGVNESAQRFIDHIASSMGMTSAYVAEAIATGQVWYADEAQRLGLVSGITTFDKLLVDLQQKVSENTNNAGVGSTPQPVYFQQTAEADMAKRKVIKASSPEEALAMAASGIPVESASDGAENEEEDTVTNDEDETPAEEQNDDEEDNVVEESESNSEAAATASLSKMIEVTTGQLVQAKVDLATTKAEVAVLQEKVTTLQATEEQLKKIVAVSVQRGFVAGGASAPSLESLMAMSSENLIAQSVSAEEMLSKRFGTGGQVSVRVDDENDEESKKAAEAAKYSEEVLAPLSRIFSK